MNMDPQLWSWILTIFGVSTLLLQLRQNPLGWPLGVFTQTLWLSYSVVTEQWGFLGSCIAYSAVYLFTYRRWRTNLDAFFAARQRAADDSEEADPVTA
jgi:hypothetical protein